ncbi:MAG: hypothetical protein AB7O04_08105 [Hyphomonadaceae bacterium]
MAMLKAALAALALAASTPVLQEAAWTEPGAARAHHLTHAPAECLPWRARTAEAELEIELGRALFRSPALLGGPAARIGISCHSCHLNGRANAHFLLPELTDRAGHADVTSEWASAVRGDGIANPVVIPDLVGVRDRTAFGAARDPSLSHFIRGVIVEEFQGPEPRAEALAALVAYVRALDANACPTQGETAIALADAADDVRRAVSAAKGPARSEGLLAAQAALGRIAERLPARTFARERRMLALLGGDLGQARNGVLADDWLPRLDGLVTQLRRKEQLTYFNEATLAAALEVHN